MSPGKWGEGGGAQSCTEADIRTNKQTEINIAQVCLAIHTQQHNM